MITSGRVRFHPDLEPLLRPIGDIEAHPENHNNGDVEAIGESIDENGMCDVVLVQASTGYIISGNHTYYALLERDSELCPYVLLDVGDLRAAKIMVAMNAIPRRAQPDNAALLRTLVKIEQASTLRGTGIEQRNREALERLAEMRPSYARVDWPWLTVQLHPKLMKTFRRVTAEADTDADRIELLILLAGGR